MDELTQVQQADSDDESEFDLMIDILANKPRDTIVSKTALARVFNVKPRTIQRMVERRELPPPITLAKQSVWLTGRIIEHLNCRAATAEQEIEEMDRKISRMKA
jgi:predicted DNA-binding transcriptional regulator AlpA